MNSTRRSFYPFAITRMDLTSKSGSYSRASNLRFLPTRTAELPDFPHATRGLDGWVRSRRVDANCLSQALLDVGYSSIFSSCFGMKSQDHIVISTNRWRYPPIAMQKLLGSGGSHLKGIAVGHGTKLRVRGIGCLYKEKERIKLFEASLIKSTLRSFY